MDRPPLHPLRVLFSFVVFLIANVLFDNILTHISKGAHIVARWPKMAAPGLLLFDVGVPSKEDKGTSSFEGLYRTGGRLARRETD